MTALGLALASPDVRLGGSADMHKLVSIAVISLTAAAYGGGIAGAQPADRPNPAISTSSLAMPSYSSIP